MNLIGTILTFFLDNCCFCVADNSKSNIEDCESLIDDDFRKKGFLHNFDAFRKRHQ